jgi:assimilatory nitrate reductase catalytic subunit
LKEATSKEYPFRLNTGRVRDQWHTMTRTGVSPRLSAHAPEPFVEVHPKDAAAFGLVDGGFAKITTHYGCSILKVAVSAGQRRCSLFVPIHWSDATASCARTCEMVMPATDPFSGQPEAKATPAAIAPVAFQYSGFAVSRRPIKLMPGIWWARVAIAGGTGLLLATDATPSELQEQVRDMFPAEAELAEYVDRPRGVYRVAAFVKGRLEGCLFVGPAQATPQWDVVKVLLEADTIGDGERRMLLSGRATDGIAETGPLVCACFGVGLAAIRKAIISGDASNVEEIGNALRAGTNCGSCVPELKKIIADELVLREAV